MIIETERLILRPWEEEDAEELFKYASHPLVGPNAGWPIHKSADESRDIIKHILSAPETYAAVLKATGKPVGCVGLKTGKASSLLTSDSEAEIGYWIGKPYWGNGLIPEAVMAIERRAFEELGFTLLWCGYYEGNDRSRRVQEKCGFKYDRTRKCEITSIGDRRMEIVSRLSKEEWEIQRQKLSGI